MGRRELDLSEPQGADRVLGALRPKLVINAAAYTAVDGAETEPDAARRVNADGARRVALAASRVGARLIQLSTDYVFDGSQSRPYTPLDQPNPLNVYGATKLAGEQEVLRVLDSRAVVLRTSWVFAPEGSNFLRTVLRRMAETDPVRVVADQVGSPTSAELVANAVWALAAHAEVSGVLHWTGAGVATWYDFAVAIQEEALTAGLLSRSVRVIPIRTGDYPATARRPSYSVLDCSATAVALGLAPEHWRTGLRRAMQELAGG